MSIAHVSEVVLTRTQDGLSAVAIEIGAAGVLRRLGLGRLSARMAQQLVDWHDLHLTSPRGHAIQLATRRRRPPAQAGGVGLVGRAPAQRARRRDPPGGCPGHRSRSAEHVAPPARGQAATRLPQERGRRAWQRRSSSACPRTTPPPCCAHCPRRKLDRLLAEVPTERAAALRRLLSHRVDTAGGLMNTAVRTARVDEPVETIRDRVAGQPVEPEGLAAVFVLGDGRPIGMFDPTDLLAGRTESKPVPAVPVDLPVDRVIDLFALNHSLALPVGDAGGRLLGAIAVDDVLEELLIERLPGHARFARIRRRPHRLRARARLGQALKGA